MRTAIVIGIRRSFCLNSWIKWNLGWFLAASCSPSISAINKSTFWLPFSFWKALLASSSLCFSRYKKRALSGQKGKIIRERTGGMAPIPNAIGQSVSVFKTAFRVITYEIKMPIVTAS